MQILKMLLSSLPYHFKNLVLLGDFPKSTINVVKEVSAENKVLCSLSDNTQVTELTKRPFPVVGSLAECTTYNEANLKGFSSIKSPTNIKQLLPGILFNKKRLDTQPMDSFLFDTTVSSDQANIVLLNVNGAELEYLVEDSWLLNSFNCILVSCSNTDIFEGTSNSFETLISHLKQNHIPYSVFPAEVHPFSFVLIHRCPGWGTHNNELKEAGSDNENHQSEISQLTGEIEQLRKQLEGVLQELQKSKEQRKSIDEQLQQLIQEKAWLESELNTAKSQVEQQNQATKITNKLNLKLHVDLDNLRQKYSEKEQNERELSQLIDELYVKLKQASEFYYELEKKYPELMDEQRD